MRCQSGLTHPTISKCVCRHLLRGYADDGDIGELVFFQSVKDAQSNMIEITERVYIKGVGSVADGFNDFFI